MIAYFNGRFLPEDRCAVPASDSGFLYGDGAYDTLRAYEGSILFAREHLKRLKGDLLSLGIPLPMDEKGFHRAMGRVLKKNRLKNAILRITVTRGRVLSGSPDFAWGTPTVFITARPFSGYPRRYYLRGVPVITVPWVRGTRPKVKSTSFQPHLLARVKARKKGAFEALLVDEKGRVLEGSMSNVFIITKGGDLRTPPLNMGILPGVTRRRIIEAGRKMGIPVKEKPIVIKDILSSQGAFLTSTSMECVPISRVNGRRVGLPDPALLSFLWHTATTGR